MHITIFSFLFLSQILLISFYFPRKMIKRMQFVLETYPPAKFPNLYPKTPEYYEKAQQSYRKINLYIGLVGFLFLAILLSDSSNDDWGGIVFIYYMVQSIPLIILEIGTYNHYKLMREADTRTKRKAKLQPRRLFDFVSPTALGIAVVVYFAFILFIVFINQFDFPWFGGYANVVGVTMLNLIFVGIIVWNLFGKKLDPYQAHEDRTRQMELVVKQLIFTSIAATLFIIINVVLNALDSHHLTQIVMSIYLQVLSVVGLQTLRVDSINFEVYREEPLAI